MCKFNSGCPGWQFEYGYEPCSMAKGCATSAITVSLADARRLGMSRDEVRQRLILSDDGKERLLVMADGWKLPNDVLLDPPSFAL